jgi:hypothetical protein
MFGYDYEIIYKMEKENVVVDALLRKCKIPNFLARSNNCNKVLKPLWDTLGTIRRFAIKVVCI